MVLTPPAGHRVRQLDADSSGLLEEDELAILGQVLGLRWELVGDTVGHAHDNKACAHLHSRLVGERVTV